MLAVKPDFIDLFVMIGRLGRSLGVHLLLASQRLEEGRLRGLDTHLSYRIGLRTFSALESRTVLGVADAYELPRTPGHGYLKYGTEPLTRFRAAYVSGPYTPPTAEPAHHRAEPAGPDAGPAPGRRGRIRDYPSHHVPVPDPDPTPPEPRPAADRDSLLDILARFIHLEAIEAEIAGKKARKENMIFPRYHQLDAVRKIETASKAEGAGNNYLVMHSAGSGKSNSIAWLAHRLARQACGIEPTDRPKVD